jgi:exo-1,4-beta-D-glucosaminidase
MLGWCCCDHWEHWKDWTAEDLTIATASLRSQMLRLRHHASLLVWLNGSDNAPPTNVERAYLDVERRRTGRIRFSLRRRRR